jgi:hypothetical protein
MFRRKVEAPVVRIVWRMDAAHPAGGFVDPTEAARDTVATRGTPGRGWLESSFDLRDGVRVSEAPLDALPDEVIEFFLRR